MLISGIEQSDSVIHASILFKFLGRYIILSWVPVLCNRLLLVIHFKYSSMHMSIPSKAICNALILYNNTLISEYKILICNKYKQIINWDNTWPRARLLRPLKSHMYKLESGRQMTVAFNPILTQSNKYCFQ